MIDVELYGGRSGFLEHLRARLLYAVGAYRTVHGIEWGAVRRLAFVCKGNICRSPYACARARSLGVPAVSFGLDAALGAPADPAASENALRRGIDLSAHRSARLESAHLADGDLVIAFEPDQIAAVRRRTANDTPAQLLGIWVRPVRPHIQDPYGMSDKYFQQCFSVIDANLAALVEFMAKGAAPATDGRQTGILRPQAEQRNSGDRMLG